ncbi:MAG TPA: lasso peptide biosynthesis B2 protein, partial [Ktedonobacteraceae bacterium]
TAYISCVPTGEDAAVLLDTQTGRFFGINTMGLLWWELLVQGYTPLHLMEVVKDQYVIEAEERLWQDIENFLKQMQDHGLLAVADSTSTDQDVCSRIAQPSRVFQRWGQAFPSLLRFVPLSERCEAWCALRYVHACLLQGKLLALTRQLQLLPTTEVVAYEHPTVRRFARYIQSAAVWQPFHAACLHQNLTLCLLLRRRALEAECVIGVATHPFFSHAWSQSGLEIIQWEPGLGPGASRQRLEKLTIIFRTSMIALAG